MELTVKYMSSVFQLLVLSSCFLLAAAAPYQELLPRPGYVPVYIREGDTPLEDINPKLAEAFHEIEASNLMFEIGQNVAKKDALLLTNDQIMEESEQPETIAGAKDKEHEQREIEVKDTKQSATQTEEKNPAKETDIASFDVVKME